MPSADAVMVPPVIERESLPLMALFLAVTLMVPLIIFKSFLQVIPLLNEASMVSEPSPLMLRSSLEKSTASGSSLSVSS